MKINLPRFLWYGNDLFPIDLPDDWDVQYCPMNGADKKPLSVAQMREAVQKPLNTPPLAELGVGKKSAVIVFDDMTRPTRTFELAPIVVEELIAGGIDEEQIVFVCALGTHGTLTQNEFRKKLGNNITKRFRVFNHNIYENCVEIGTTHNGTKMMINLEVAEADLKIGISCVTPHIKAGFSGGGKLILPGIAHIDSISHYHKNVEAKGKETTGMGKRHQNILREEIDEASAIVGMDFFINVIVNSRGFTTDIFAGDMAISYEQAVDKAATHYAIDPIPCGKDLTIANAFVKANEMPIALFLGTLPLHEMRGTIVVIADSPEGQVVHHLFGRFGRNYGGRQYPVGEISENIDLIILAPHLDKTFGDWFSNPEVITWTESWEETRTLLESKFGAGTKVAVIPNATLAYFKI
jgi:nickel-dependent lactate racemase